MILQSFLRRRLKAISSDIDVYDMDGESKVAEANIDENTLAQWCDAISDVLLKDLAHFEMAHIVNDMPPPFLINRWCCQRQLRLRAALAQLMP